MGERRVGDEAHRPLLGQLGHEIEEGGGLAGADLTGDEDESFAVLDPVAEVCQRLDVLVALEDEPWIGCERERVLAQMKKLFEHRPCFRRPRVPRGYRPPGANSPAKTGGDELTRALRPRFGGRAPGPPPGGPSERSQATRGRGGGDRGGGARRAAPPRTPGRPT